MRGVIRRLRCSKHMTYTMKPPKQTRGFTFFKRGSIGDFKIVMQIYAERIYVTCFFGVSMFRPTKTCRKIKIRNARAYKRVGLWTGEIQISKVKNQFKLLCTKKIRRSNFNLSSGRNVTWAVNWLVPRTIDHVKVKIYLCNVTTKYKCHLTLHVTIPQPKHPSC